MAEYRVADRQSLRAGELEIDHLLMVARAEGDQVREMCARAGVGEGARVIDVGCGPMGALLDLAEMVGPSGSVVGLDSRPAFLEVAGRIVAGRGVGEQVSLVEGDINTADAAQRLGDRPFDAAFLRSVLFHQPDPAETLRHIAALLRPGGRILVCDPLDDPRYPWFDPVVPEAEQAWSLFYRAMEAWGQAPDVARRMPAVCAEAGLEIADQRGYLPMHLSPPVILTITANILTMVRGGIVEVGLASPAEIDRLCAAIYQARERTFRRYVPYVFMQTIIQTPWLTG